jgi:Coenzyme PQQ synthesis protein D (PqqD)
VRFQREENLTWEDLGDRAVIVLTEDRWITLDRTALELWRLLSEPRTVDDLVAGAMSRYSGAESEIRRDIRETLDDWLGRGLVRCVAAS